MAKTQPLRTTPQPKAPSAPVIVTAAKPALAAPSGGGPVGMLDAVPVPIAGVICLISAVTLLIQIWNYFGG